MTARSLMARPFQTCCKRKSSKSLPIAMMFFSRSKTSCKSSAECCDDASTPLSFRRVRRRQGSTSQNTNTYYILRTRAEGIRPPAEAGPRTLPDRSLDRVAEGRISLEKEAYGRLARGMWMVVALCAHLNNSENGRHKEIFPYRQLLARSFWYCAFVHAFTSGDVERHRPSLWP